MSRPKHPNLATCLALVQSGQMSAAQAAKAYGVAKSSISRALSAKHCDKCGHVIRKTVIDKNEFDEMVKRGSKAWADVPADFVENLRGNTKEK